MPENHSLLEQAVGLHQGGDLAGAAQIYKKIILENKNHFDATHLLGVIAFQEGRLDEARDLIRRALRVNPKDSAALNNLGMVSLRSGDLDSALDEFERAVKMQPKSLDALANFGTVLRQLGRPREGLVPLRRAHGARPQSAMVSNLIGACLMDTGEPHEAVKYFEIATRAEPDNADGWSNLAIALNSIGEHERAQAYADKAVAMRPSSSSALAARAAVEFEDGRIDMAIETYREAMALPDPSPQTYCAYANALWISGRCHEALDYLSQSAKLDENYAIAPWKLAMSHCRPFYDGTAEMQASRQDFSNSLEDLRAWFHAAPRPQAYTAVGSTQPFFIAYQPFNNRDLLTRYGELCVEWMSSMPIDASPAQPRQRIASPASPAVHKMRIGIASSHIRDHSVWNAITKGWVQQFDTTRFEIWLFQLGRNSDEETLSAKRRVAHFKEGPKTVEEWVRTISDARLDALIYPEIGMNALTTQLASLRLAPVQAATWGHAETTGIPTLDLYLSADGMEPADADGNYSERLVRLPNLGVCVEPLAPPIVVPNLLQLGLPDDEPLLLCPGTSFKYSPMHDHLWARIARGLSSTGSKRGWARIADRLRGKGVGRLVFFRSGNAVLDGFLRQRLGRAFDREKVDFESRVCMIPYLGRSQFYGLMQRSALLLDTVGFSGFNNALQAIEAGLPVVAREGPFMRGRLASGIMRRMGMADLVATTDEAFIEMAVDLAHDAERRHELSIEISKRRNILFHDTAPVRALERCLTEAIERSRGAIARDS